MVAFEEPPDERSLAWMAAPGNSGESDHATRGACAVLDKAVGRFLEQETDGGQTEKRGKSEMDRWVKDYGSALQEVEEPELTELQAFALEIGTGATVLDPWQEERAREAAAKASRWAEASKAYAEAQARRSRGERKGLVNSSGSKCSAKLRAPCLKDEALPALPLVEEEEEAPGSPKGVPPASGERERKLGAESKKAGAPHSGKNESSSSTSSSRRRRPRGKRRRGQKDGAEEEVVVWSLNSSGAPQLRAALEHASGMKKGRPCAVLSQEHHACKARLPDLQAQARKKGWNIAAAEAVLTDATGRSAGVGVCTPVHSTLGRLSGEEWNWSTPGSPGRAVAGWVQQVVPGGIYLASCYLHEREGGTERNRQLLSNLLVKLRASRCPWILGLDAQQEPTELARWAAPLLEKVGGENRACRGSDLLPWSRQAQMLGLLHNRGEAGGSGQRNRNAHGVQVPVTRSPVHSTCGATQGHMDLAEGAVCAALETGDADTQALRGGEADWLRSRAGGAGGERAHARWERRKGMPGGRGWGGLGRSDTMH